MCPRCKQEHAIIDRAVFLGLTTGKGIAFECPITHEQIILFFTMKTVIPTECDKEELRVAEEDAEFRDYQWKADESIKGDKESESPK